MGTHAASNSTIIHVEGVLDVPAAQRVAQELAGVDGHLVHVDLTRVREFHDFGVALLGRALVGRAGVSVSGLRQHHLRLLRYLGLEAGAGADALGEARELA